MIKTPQFQHRGLGFNPWSGHKPSGQKKKKKRIAWSCVLSGSSREESVSLPSSASRACLHSLASDLFPHFQSQQSNTLR